MAAFHVILLPGAVLPSELAYGDLIAAFGPDVEAAAKDLELYAASEPPENYSLDLEVAGVIREADARGWERFHLVGYSAGGAAALATAVSQSERVASLALLEPASAGSWDQSPAEQGFWKELKRLEALPPDEFFPAFMRLELKPDVPLPEPPTGAPPPWMATRPAGIRAFTRAVEQDDIDPESLRRFDRPVYYALGGLSNPHLYEEIAKRLETVFGDYELEVFEERHHFDPPHRIEPERLANSLRSVWQRAQSGVTET